MYACIIFNPASCGKNVQKRMRLLTDLAQHCPVKTTYYPGEARLLAATAVREGFDTIVAAGGDGTVSEILNGIGDERDGFAKTRLAIVPLGLRNAFARELKLPFDVNQAWNAVRHGKEKAIDLSQVEYIGVKGAPRYFAQSAAIGFQASAGTQITSEPEQKAGQLTKIAVAIKSLAQRRNRIRVAWSEGSAAGEIAFLGNGAFGPKGGRLFSKSNLSDGFLDICIIPRSNWQLVFRVGVGVLTGSLPRLCRAKTIQSEAFTITADQKTTIQLDGENAGELPARFTTRKQALRVIVP